MKSNEVYNAAQAAADTYLREIERLKENAQQEREQIIAAANDEANEALEKTKSLCSQRINEVSEKIKRANAKIEAYFKAHPEIERHQS